MLGMDNRGDQGRRAVDRTLAVANGSRQDRRFASTVAASTWTVVACTGFRTPRSWQTTESVLERNAQETAAADIWVSPNLVMRDCVKRQDIDEVYELFQRPEMRYLRPATRD